MDNESELKYVLKNIENNETNYEIREILIAQAMYLAKKIGYKAGIRFGTLTDENDNGNDWPVWCIELPNIGEISWHCPSFKGVYDGYTTNEKYDRIHKYLNK